MAPYSLFLCNPSLKVQRFPNGFYRHYLHPFNVEIFTVAAQLKELARNLSEVCAPAQQRYQGVNNTELLETYFMPDELCGAILCFFFRSYEISSLAAALFCCEAPEVTLHQHDGG